MFCNNMLRRFTTSLEKTSLLKFAAPSLMEALSTTRIVPIQSPCRKLSSLFTNLSSLELRRFPSRGQLSIMNHPKLLPPVTASLQRQELSALGQEEGNVAPSIEILDLWRSAEAVCFDVDSTVCVDEGIDELA